MSGNGKQRKPARPAQEDSLFGSEPAAASPKLGVVRARFEGRELLSFEDLVSGFSSMRVLTYSNSVSMLARAAEAVEDVEVVFGREDIIGEATKLFWYQNELLKAVRDEVRGKGLLEEKVESGGLRLFVVKDLISHEKLFLLEGEGNRRRVVTGSANLSERAFSGRQNEGYVLYEDDGAWEYYERRYESIKASSALGVPKRALLAEYLDAEDLPAFSKDAGPVVAVEDGVPENGVVHKVVSSATPRHFAGLAGVAPKSKGVVRLDKKARVGAVSYVRANSRTPTENPEEYLSFRASTGEVVLSGKALDLRPSGEAVGADARALLEYFGGFSLFRGESEKLARDFFAFWGWLWFGPFMCDLRNRAQAGHDHVHDYPIFGILYGKSNCGKSELVDTLQRSMFGRHGTAQNDWFTTNRVANLMAENRRYPLVFDDLGKDRYSKYAVDLIKEDHVRLPEYPVVVLSMNGAQDAFETEVRKRSFVVYTGASLPDDDPSARNLGRSVKRIKAGLGTAFYREYLRRLLPRLAGDGPEGPSEEPVDYLALSSSVIVEIVSEHHEGALPAWCRVVTADEQRRGRHDKIREDLRQLLASKGAAWERGSARWTLTMPDHHAAKRLRKDVPDYLLSTGNVGNLVVFDAAELKSFLGKESGERGPSFISRLMGRR